MRDLFLGFTLNAAICAATAAQPVGDISWAFELGGDAQDGIIDLSAGESTAHVQLLCAFSPGPDPPDIEGFANAFLDLVGGGVSASASLLNHRINPYLDIGAPYTIDGSNSFRSVFASQDSPLFNPEFDDSDPIWVFEFDWVSDGTLGDVGYETVSLSPIVIHPIFGGASWNETPGWTGWTVIPSPATVTALGLFVAAVPSRQRHFFVHRPASLTSKPTGLGVVASINSV